MATAVADRVSRTSAPESVEADLAALWRELAGRGPVARAVMSNLIVCRRPGARDDRAPDDRGATDNVAGDRWLDAVMASHPSRTIVLEHDWHDEDAAVIDANVSVAVFGESTNRYGVEQIVIRTASSDTSLLSIVRRFTRGDLPTTLWWTRDLSGVAPPPALLDTTRQLVFDSRSWRDLRAGVRALAPLVAENRIDLADVNWRRLGPIGRALTDAATAIDENISGADVRITHRPGEAALAWLLAGCIASTLEWTADDPWPTIQEAEQDERLTLTIAAGGPRLRLAMNDHRVIVEKPGVAAQVSAVPRDDEAAAIAAELRSLSRDRSFHDAIGALVARVVQS